MEAVEARAADRRKGMSTKRRAPRQSYSRPKKSKKRTSAVFARGNAGVSPAVLKHLLNGGYLRNAVLRYSTLAAGVSPMSNFIKT